MKTPDNAIAMTSLAAILLYATAFAGEIKRFSSARLGYEIEYPQTWQLIDPTSDYLEIVNFPWETRVHGVVLPAHGARISVAGAPEGISGVQTWIAQQTRGGPPPRLREIAASPASEKSCRTLTVAVAHEEVGPNAYQTVSTYYCDTRQGPYAITLINWADDQAQADYERTALAIARSLRTTAAPKPRRLTTRSSGRTRASRRLLTDRKRRAARRAAERVR